MTRVWPGDPQALDKLVCLWGVCIGIKLEIAKAKKWFDDNLGWWYGIYPFQGAPLHATQSGLLLLFFIHNLTVICGWLLICAYFRFPDLSCKPVLVPFMASLPYCRLKLLLLRSLLLIAWVSLRAICFLRNHLCAKRHVVAWLESQVFSTIRHGS